MFGIFFSGCVTCLDLIAFKAQHLDLEYMQAKTHVMPSKAGAQHPALAVTQATQRPPGSKLVYLQEPFMLRINTSSPSSALAALTHEFEGLLRVRQDLQCIQLVAIQLFEIALSFDQTNEWTMTMNIRNFLESTLRRNVHIVHMSYVSFAVTAFIFKWKVKQSACSQPYGNYRLG